MPEKTRDLLLALLLLGLGTALTATAAEAETPKEAEEMQSEPEDEVDLPTAIAAEPVEIQVETERPRGKGIDREQLVGDSRDEAAAGMKEAMSNFSLQMQQMMVQPPQPEAGSSEDADASGEEQAEDAVADGDAEPPRRKMRRRHGG